MEWKYARRPALSVSEIRSAPSKQRKSEGKMFVKERGSLCSLTDQRDVVVGGINFCHDAQGRMTEVVFT